MELRSGAKDTSNAINGSDEEARNGENGSEPTGDEGRWSTPRDMSENEDAAAEETKHLARALTLVELDPDAELPRTATTTTLTFLGLPDEILLHVITEVLFSSGTCLSMSLLCKRIQHLLRHNRLLVISAVAMKQYSLTYEVLRSLTLFLPITRKIEVHISSRGKLTPAQREV